jgi:hypothetical protein
MDLFESNDQKKMDLLNRSSQHRQGVEDEVKLISERTQRIVTNALIVGGTLAATYFIARKISKRSKKKGHSKKVKNIPASMMYERESHVEEESDSPGVMSKIGSALLSQATIFLLGIAKEKISQFLQTPPVKAKAENNNNEHP